MTVLLLLSLALGLLATPRALGGRAWRASCSPGPGASTPAARPTPDPTRPLDDLPEVLTFLRERGEGAVGQRVRVVGIVGRSTGSAPGEFALLRLSIAHGVADARRWRRSVVGAAAESPTDQ